MDKKKGLSTVNENMSKWSQPAPFKPISSPAKEGGSSQAGGLNHKTANSPGGNQDKVSSFKKRY